MTTETTNDNTAPMEIADIIYWIDSHEANSELTTICPANFFTSVRHHIADLLKQNTEMADLIWAERKAKSGY